MSDKMLESLGLYRRISLYGLISLLAIAVAAGASVFAARQIAKNSDAIIRNELAAVALQRRSESIQRLRADLQKISPQIPLIESSIVDGEKLPDFLSSLEAIGKEHGLSETMTIGSPVPTDIASAGAVSYIDFQMSVSGNIGAVTPFIERLEKLPYLLVVRSVSLDASQGWNSNSNFSMSGRFYIRVPQ